MVVNSSGTVLETRDYYPFTPLRSVSRPSASCGLEMPGRSYVSGTKAKENFTGHERDAETGMLYAGARYYMPNIGRWTSVDPLAASYPAWSPYNYVLNNPLGYTDPTGECPVPTLDCYAFTKGAIKGAWNAAVGTVQGVASLFQRDTYTSLGHALRNPGETVAALQEAAVGRLTEAAASPESAGELAGELSFAVGEIALGSKGVGALAKGMRAADKASDLVSVYRVYGGDSGASGFSWTPVNPNSLANFRDVAGLPSGGASGSFNTGRPVIEGTAQRSDIIKQRKALPLDGNAGGLREILIDPQNIKVRRVSGLNPEF